MTGFVDLDRRVLLDLVEEHSGEGVRRWLGSFDTDWLQAVTTVAIDPHRGFKGGLQPLGHTRVVCDPFHVVRLGNSHLDETRRRVQQEIHGHRGHKGDPLYRIRRLLLVASERLSESGWRRLRAGLDDPKGDPFMEVEAGYLAKEMLRQVYAAKSLAEAQARLEEFLAWCDQCQVPEVASLGREIARWRKEVLAYHEARYSNGPTEAINLLVEKARRVGHGFRNFKNYRLRLLLYCGGCNWDTQPTTRLRGRSPRTVA